MTTDRYSVQWVEDLFSAEATAAGWLAVSREVLRAARAHGLVPSSVEPDTVPDRFNETDFVVMAQREAELGHDVAAFLSVVREVVASDTRDWVHFGLTSSNLVDTSLVMTLHSAASWLGAEAGTLGQTLEALPSVARASRTHGQLAEASYLSVQGQAWAARVLGARMELFDATAGLRASLGGPTGRYETFSRQAAVRASGMLGVVLESHSEQAVRRDQIARWGRSVADLATAAAHFALQVRLGARDGELFEPTGVSRYVGSSSMAFKQNPTRSERICGLERVTRALAGALDANVVWWDQRDLSASSVERVVVPQLVGLTAYCLVEATNVARGLTVDARVCEANLARIPESPAELWRRVADGMSHEAAYEVGRGAGRGPGPTGAPEATKEASVADEEGSS